MSVAFPTRICTNFFPRWLEIIVSTSFPFRLDNSTRQAKEKTPRVFCSNQISAQKSLPTLSLSDKFFRFIIDRETFFLPKEIFLNDQEILICFWFFEFLNRLPLSLVSVCHGRNDDAPSATAAAATRLERHGMSL